MARKETDKSDKPRRPSWKRVCVPVHRPCAGTVLIILSKMDAKLKKMEARLNPEGETEEEARARRRREKEEKAAKKKERKEIRGIAKKSLDVANWTGQLLDGADSRYGPRMCATGTCI